MSERRNTRLARLLRTAAATAGGALAVCVVAGTAWGATSAWQDVWSQIKPLLSSPGTVNAADNPVHWTKLNGVPAGFADGLDNGDKPGFGLKRNVFPESNLAIDPTKVQRRITGSCADLEAATGVTVDGTLQCGATAPEVVFGWKTPKTAGPVYENLVTVGGALEVPAGSWTLHSTVEVRQGANLDVICVLEGRTGGRVTKLGTGHASGDAPESGPGSIPIVAMGVFTAAEPWHAAVRCRAGTRPTWWDDVRILATRASTITSTQLTF